MNEWMWLIKTNKGDFFITVLGGWTQEEAATRVKGVFEIIVKLNIIGMIPRKRASGPIDMTCTIIEQQSPKDKVGFDFLAGERLWHLCGRGPEYEAQRILLKEAMEVA